MLEPLDQDAYIDGFVLVGGSSSRMGRDKAQMVIGGQKLFERSALVLSEFGCRSISLVGVQSGFLADSTDIDIVAVPDLHVIDKDLPRAPIVGLYTALAKAMSPWIVVLACDLPFATGDLMTKLAEFCSNEFDAVVPIQSDARPQPLCAFYRRERCLTVVEEMLKTGDLKLQQFLSLVSTIYVEFDEIADLDGSAHFFLNVNEPDDYEAALKICA